MQEPHRMQNITNQIKYRDPNMKSEVIISEKEKLAQTRARLEKRQKLINEQERKIKFKKMIELGELLVKSELDELDMKVLFGALLEIKESASNKNSIKRWTEKHEAWLQSNHPQRLIISFIGEASADGIAALKTRKFRWNAFRQEWYGFGKKEELQTLLAKDNVEITEVTK